MAAPAEVVQALCLYITLAYGLGPRRTMVQRRYSGLGTGLGSDGNTDVSIGTTGPIIVHGDACALIRNAFSEFEPGMLT